MLFRTRREAQYVHQQYGEDVQSHNELLSNI